MNTAEQICDAARKYCRQGFAPIPIPHGKKGPVQRGWQYLRIAEQNLHLHFNGELQNVGILLGEASGGLVDVDLDCPEAEDLADQVLPDTGLKTGRKSKPKSHYFYRATGLKTKKFTDPEDRSMLVELRSDGSQTVFPPSGHPSGESYSFATEGEPALIAADELVRIVSELAGFALLSKRWPAKGSRQDTALALAGALLRSGLGIESVERVIRLVCHAAHDEEISKRVSAVRTTATRLACGGNVVGFSKLKQLVGNKVASTALEWLGRDRHEQRSSVNVEEVAEPMDEGSTLPEFPEIAWRGIFGEYREAVRGTTEASDVAHFAALWAAAAANLGRRISIFAGDEIFPNAYILFYGPTGDKKTTAQRRIFRHDLLAPPVQVLRNVGSPEGMADVLQQSGSTPMVYLCFWEEISTLLAHGRWKGSSIFEFLTETYDCPPEYRMLYRNHPIELREPTPSILAGTTPEWFWKNAQVDDFQGGFGNRFVYLTGQKKAPIPSPSLPDEMRIESVRQILFSLASLPVTKAAFSRDAQALFERFYFDWESQERSGVYAAGVKRIHVYVRKLAMVYAACEGTLPEISADQLKASIAVALYAAECTRLLVESRLARLRPETELEGELERRFLQWVRRHDGAPKRYMQQTLSKYAGSCGVFNKILVNLQHSDRIRVDDGRVYLIG